MYESLVRIHTNYYKNKVSSGIGHHPPFGGSPGNVPGTDGQWMLQCLVLVLTQGRALWGGNWAVVLGMDEQNSWTENELGLCQMGTFVPLSCTTSDMFVSLSFSCSPVKYPRLKDTTFTGVTVEDCRMILATDILKQMEDMKKGTWRRLREKFSAKKPEEDSK
ncbi:hypothetical protein BTVI_10561 [Pitangus sulphuratus]|nr:hypothetical protein BTVI_10561 [Pitangus sulphuratus]